jgi:aerobic-type carbon monoxide dehydrogenase small subunit (CoxS/CutS family)
LRFRLDGRDVELDDEDVSLLEAVRDRLGVTAPKDGCSPQGQCGCCTVLVDGQPRVACVTPARRVAGREVTTVDGLPADERDAWADAFCATGASQCGFCTPGIVMRLSAVRAKGGDTAAVQRALLAHLCRCTGWRTVLEAYDAFGASHPARDLAAATRRATIEGRTHQEVGSHVALGRGGFADDTAPRDALVAVPGGVGPTLRDARAAAAKVQGRRTTIGLTHPLDVPPGDWDLTLRTTWVEPAYLETDASWCAPGDEPATPLANGGAFGAKTSTAVADDARALADDAAIGGQLLDWKARGSQVEYLGTEDVDGTEAHKIKVTLANGDVEYLYLDPDHFLEIRMVAQRHVRGTVVESVSDYGDYEKVAGAYFPFSITTENKADGGRSQVTIEHAQANVPMDDALFAFPATAGAGK